MTIIPNVLVSTILSFMQHCYGMQKDSSKDTAPRFYIRRQSLTSSSFKKSNQEARCAFHRTLETKLLHFESVMKAAARRLSDASIKTSSLALFKRPTWRLRFYSDVGCVVRRMTLTDMSRSCRKARRGVRHTWGKLFFSHIMPLFYSPNLST